MFKVAALFALFAVALALPEPRPAPIASPIADPAPAAAPAPAPEPKAKPATFITHSTLVSGAVPLAYSGGYVPSVYSSPVVYV